MRNNQKTSIQPTVLPSIYIDDTSCIGEAGICHQPITLFPTKTGRVVLVHLPIEPTFDSFH